MLLGKLTVREREILAYIERQALLDVPSISRALGYAEHTLRAAIAKFRRNGLITRPAPMVDPYRLGFVDYTIYFSLTADQRSKITILTSYLQQHPSVLWLARLGGSYQYAVSFLTRHISEVRQIFEQIGEQLGFQFNNRTVSTRVSFHSYSRKYLAPRIKFPSPLSFGAAPDTSPLDDIDHSILVELANGEDTGLRSIARSLGMAHSTLHERCRRLEKREIISGYSFFIDPFKLGMSVFKILLITHPLRPDLTRRLMKTASAHPNIVNLVESVGSWDFEIGVEVYSTAEIEGVVDDLCSAMGEEIRSFQILPVLEYLKFSSYPFQHRQP